jgi:hypothetical protein
MGLSSQCSWIRKQEKHIFSPRKSQNKKTSPILLYYGIALLKTWKNYVWLNKKEEASHH